MICLGKTKQENRLRVYAENKDADQELDFMVDVSAKGSAVPKFRWAGDVAKFTSDLKSLGVKNRERVLSAVGEDWTKRVTIELKTSLRKSTITDHLRVLIEAGLVEAQKEKGLYRRLRSTGSENEDRAVD